MFYVYRLYLKVLLLRLNVTCTYSLYFISQKSFTQRYFLFVQLRSKLMAAEFHFPNCLLAGTRTIFNQSGQISVRNAFGKYTARGYLFSSCELVK